MELPHDHSERMTRARLSLDGLSVGDAFGQRFFGSPQTVERLIDTRTVPRSPWNYTDDTIMAISLVDVLQRQGTIDQGEVARCFARRYVQAPDRGYGGTAHTILHSIACGIPWREAAAAAFDGMGSMGNGGAMRVGPVGAYFADDLQEVVRQARNSAQVTHAHPDGQAGTVAVAVAAAVAWRMGSGLQARSGAELLRTAFDHTPEGETRTILAQAMTLGLDASPRLAAEALGSGRRVLSSDTVPFALWCSARHLDDYEQAMWTTVSGLGDRDTTCAIAGSVVVLCAGQGSIPHGWLDAREALL